MTEIWERDAETPDEYHSVEAIRGREFIIRLTTGAVSSLGGRLMRDSINAM